MEAKKPAVKPPKIETLGPKTFYDNHVGAEFVHPAEQLSMSDAFYIKNAKDCKFDFQGKIKNIFIEGCHGLKVTVLSMISMVEIVNSNGVSVKCNGKVPLVQIDGSMDVNVHLSKDSMETKVVSSKSTQMNVHFIGTKGDPVSEPIPAQFQSTVVNGKLVTVATELE